MFLTLFAILFGLHSKHSEEFLTGMTIWDWPRNPSVPPSM